MGKRVGMISLGCAKNQVNAEQMLYRLQQAGYTLQEDVDGADLVIVNTCGFIDSAKSEAIDNILAMGALKQEGRIGRLLVTGACRSAIRTRSCRRCRRSTACSVQAAMTTSSPWRTAC